MDDRIGFTKRIGCFLMVILLASVFTNVVHAEKLKDATSVQKIQDKKLVKNSEKGNADKTVKKNPKKQTAVKPKQENKPNPDSSEYFIAKTSDEDKYTDSNGDVKYRRVSLTPNEKYRSLYKELGNTTKSTLVIVPYLTAVAYREPGFYTHYRGECDTKCLEMKINPNEKFYGTSSVSALQIFEILGYKMLPDIAIDMNPEILKKYDRIILLHSEYATEKMFNAITSHPDVVYLYPNALYAKVSIDYNQQTMKLIRGHGYPQQSISNGFNWKFDNTKYEKDYQCSNWKFYRINNGVMLNCYPENLVFKNLNFLKAVRDIS